MSAPDPIFERNPDIVATDMDGEIVMMHVDKGAYFALNGTGSIIWELLESPASLSQIVAHVRQTHEVDPAHELTTEIAAFMENLQSNGLVIKAD
ncbi:PqqD family peptide modification chaperone [Planktotalea sp.]|uniref:PqqD family peptide modification chaperone n=1 Tax=Planktotalea sp. TaxID=2029877 RepID=UPI003D6AA2F3